MAAATLDKSFGLLLTILSGYFTFRHLTATGEHGILRGKLQIGEIGCQICANIVDALQPVDPNKAMPPQPP